MRKFKNLKTGVVEMVTNEKLVEQYTKRPETWEELKEKAQKGDATKPEK